MNRSIEDMRASYTSTPLEMADAPDDPTLLFKTWFDDAVEAQVPEPNAMTLATVGRSGLPDARVVLFKGWGADGELCFYTNYHSKKGHDLEANPFVALVFVWLPMSRQVRIQGRVRRRSTEDAQRYFDVRPRGSRIGAWASPQSTVLEDKSVLSQKVADTEARFDGEESIPLPPHWGGYEVVPLKWEFWQGQLNRLHDRIRYEQTETGTWMKERLAP